MPHCPLSLIREDAQSRKRPTHGLRNDRGLLQYLLVPTILACDDQIARAELQVGIPIA